MILFETPHFEIVGDHLIYNFLKSLCSISLLLLLCGCTIIEEEYKNLEEAQKRGAIRRGWVPQYMPVTSTKIKEIHDLDTDELWGEFKYSAMKDDLNGLNRSCKEIKPDTIIFPLIGRRKRPQSLSQEMIKNYSIYKCKPNEFMAINSSGFGYYRYLSTAQRSQ